MALLSIIVPVYNERQTAKEVIRNLVEKVREPKEIIVVDDCSSDGTFEELRNYIGENQNIKLLRTPKNLGKGAAFRLGLENAQGEWCAVFDADLEYNPEDINRLFAKTESRPEPVFVYGYRKQFEEPWILNRDRFFNPWFLGNKILTASFNFLYGKNLKDMETCLKFGPLAGWKKLNLQANRFGFDPEVTAKAAKLGIPILQIPADYFPRSKKQGKKIKFRDGVSALVTLIRERFRN